MIKKWVGWTLLGVEAILTLAIRWYDGYFELAPLWIVPPVLLVICGTLEEQFALLKKKKKKEDDEE